MDKYRKKPVVIEAFKYDGDLIDSGDNYYVPEWAENAHKNGILYFGDFNGIPSELFVKTLEGDHHVSVNDYIIQGVNNELYPCKSDIFEKTYEIVE